MSGATLCRRLPPAVIECGSNLTRFFLESPQTNAVGTRVSGHRLEPHMRSP